MKNKWETARYLIDAKKYVDRLWYISDNINQLKFIDLRKKTDEILVEFYIRCCVVVDEFISVTNQKKRDICNDDSTINRIYYERDKNAAHKDESYLKRDYSSLSDIVDDMKKELKHIRKTCAECIPDAVTLDFVPHDRELFRFIHHVTADVEESIMKKKYRLKNEVPEYGETVSLKVFNDTEDYRQIAEDDRSKYAVIINNGLCFYEGLQERQDAMIKINLLYNENMWCTPNKEMIEQVTELTKLGCFDAFGIIQDPPTDPVVLEKVMQILSKK